MLSYLSVFYHHSNFYTVSVLLLSFLCLSLVTCFPEEGPREDSETSEVIPIKFHYSGLNNISGFSMCSMSTEPRSMKGYITEALLPSKSDI